MINIDDGLTKSIASSSIIQSLLLPGDILHLFGPAIIRTLSKSLRLWKRYLLPTLVLSLAFTAKLDVGHFREKLFNVCDAAVRMCSRDPLFTALHMWLDQHGSSRSEPSLWTAFSVRYGRRRGWSLPQSASCPTSLGNALQRTHWHGVFSASRIILRRELR